MKIILNWLFFTFYNMSLRKGIVPERANVTTYMVTSFIYLAITFELLTLLKVLINGLVLAGIFLMIGIGNFIVTKNYFITKRNYIKIVELNKGQSTNTKRLRFFLGIVIIFSSGLIFIVSMLNYGMKGTAARKKSDVEWHKLF